MEEKKEESKEEEKQVVKKKKSATEKCRENPWVVSTFVLGIFALVLIVTSFSGGITGGTISADDAGEKLIEFYSSMGASGLELDSVDDMDNFYLVNFEYEGDLVSIAVTKDGRFAGNLQPLEYEAEQEELEQEIAKSDKPVVELFVMTHCPYGTQAEKGFVPFIEALGDVVDAKIRFVHYFMHEPEETETPIQVCIREEQSEKYLDYLRCFLEDGDSDRCLVQAKIDKVKMNSCVSSGKADEYYEEDSTLSEQYGVQGSPTLVVNGVVVNSGRSAAAYLDIVCQAFNTAPEECALELDSQTPSPMWGWDASGSDSGAQC